MGLKNAKEGKLLYHLTELKNLESIIDSGRCCRSGNYTQERSFRIGRIFEMIDWDTLTRVGQNDENARQIKMAECLSPLVIPVDAFQCIYVSSKETENKVADMLKQKGIIFPPPFITVMSQWFE